MGKATVYCIMHTERCVAQVSTAGECKIYFEDFMPYGLVLKESNDFDTRINNVISFHSWCASRLIPRDRTSFRVHNAVDCCLAHRLHHLI